MASSNIRIRVDEELQRIEEDCTHTSKSHFEAGTRWAGYHYALGIPAVLLGAVAGTVSLNQLPELGGGLALAAALLTALQTFLKPGDRSASHKSVGDSYLALKNDARVFRQIGLLTADDETAVRQVTDFNQRRNDLNAASPQFSPDDRRKALASIEAGEAQHAIDSPQQG